MTSSSHIPWDEGLLRSHCSQAGGRDRHGPEETSASSPAAGRPQALRAGETSAQTPRGSSPQGGALAAAAKDHRWADSFSPRSPSSRCRQDLLKVPGSKDTFLCLSQLLEATHIPWLLAFSPFATVQLSDGVLQMRCCQLFNISFKGNWHLPFVSFFTNPLSLCPKRRHDGQNSRSYFVA